jgi:replicative DNA helicase
MHGHNVGICTLEMSEKAFAQRFDSIYSMLDINRMYTNNQMKRDLYSALKTLKKQEGRGDLYIKEFPTGTASTANFRIWLRELAMRGKAPEILYCDYVNLMKPEYGSKDSMYGDVKKISEELRAIGFEFNIPVVSVSQLNRSGSFLTLEEVDMNSISESSGLGATADFVAILGSDEDAMVYESEVAYKICKSRFGHSGIINRLYLDDRSLKLYDVSEMDLWIEDSKRSGGSTNIYNKG